MINVALIIIIIIILFLICNEKDGFTNVNVAGNWKNEQDNEQYHIEQTHIKVTIHGKNKTTHGYISTDNKIVVPLGQGIGTLSNNKLTWQNGNTWIKL